MKKTPGKSREQHRYRGVNNEKFLEVCDEVVGIRAGQGITRHAKEKIDKDRS